MPLLHLLFLLHFGSNHISLSASVLPTSLVVWFHFIGKWILSWVLVIRDECAIEKSIRNCFSTCMCFIRFPINQNSLWERKPPSIASERRASYRESRRIIVVRSSFYFYLLVGCDHMKKWLRKTSPHDSSKINASISLLYTINLSFRNHNLTSTVLAWIGQALGTNTTRKCRVTVQHVSGLFQHCQGIRISWTMGWNSSRMITFRFTYRYMTES